MKGKIYTHTPQQSSRCTENGVKKVCFFIFFFFFANIYSTDVNL